MSVKETRFRRHPVSIEEGLFLGTEQRDISGIVLDLVDALLTSATSQDDTSWTIFDIAALAVVAETTKPAAAIAVILDVAVNDAGSAGEECSLALATPGIILASRTQYIYAANVNDRINSRTVIVELSECGKIAYSIIASGAVFDYTIKLIGWIVGGDRITQVTFPSVDLFCKFQVNH